MLSVEEDEVGGGERGSWEKTSGGLKREKQARRGQGTFQASRIDEPNDCGETAAELRTSSTALRLFPRLRG